jgi:anionic cell wall polymer biosynthesis LytR-Cps2A-Psr (LCP) family protein
MLAFFNRAKKERNVDTLGVLANSLLQYVHTNMDPNLLIQLCVDAVLSDQFSLKSGAVPFEDTWKYARVNGASVIQLNIEENKELLNAFLYGEN